ncbi:MAG: hypothetical protein QXW01_02095 [Candidatus Aenigmatarchaeota archaeon]
MKVKHILIFVFFVAIIAFYIFIFKEKNQIVLIKIIGEKSNNNLNLNLGNYTNFSKETPEEKFQSNYSNYSKVENYTSTYIQEEKLNFSVPKYLKFVGICSGKFFDVISVAEGMTKCINKESPYDILIDMGNESINFSLIDFSDFKESYTLNDTVLIFYLFAEDVSTVSEMIDSFFLTGSNFIDIGEYTLHTVWKYDKNGNLVIDKMIVALPIIIHPYEALQGDYLLKFYMNALNRSFYLGEVKIKIKK